MPKPLVSSFLTLGSCSALAGESLLQEYQRRGTTGVQMLYCVLDPSVLSQWHRWARKQLHLASWKGMREALR